MNLWNPFTFSVRGAPALIGAAPPALQVVGGQATAEQLSAARMVFSRFCGVARTSPVPNPTEFGSLPDGSRYRIFVVGPQATMQLWPVQGDSLRMGGISFRLTHLNGSPVDGHHRDGVPTLYLLTPLVNKGSRKSTGQWKVRTPTAVLGGKAVNATSDAKAYFAGVQGAADAAIPLTRGWWGVNGLAYKDELSGENTPVHKLSQQVGVSRFNPLPFVYQAGGESRAMQLVFRSDYSPLRIELYAGAPNAAVDPDAVFGELVATLDMLSGRSIDYRSITFKADGTEARATGTAGGRFAGYTLSITPSSLSINLDKQLYTSHLTGIRGVVEYRSETTGSTDQIGYKEEYWTTAGAGSEGSYALDTSGIYFGPDADYGLGELDFTDYGTSSHRFDRRGLPDDAALSRRTTHVSRSSDEYQSSTIIDLYPDRRQRYKVRNAREVHTARGIGDARLLYDFLDYYDLTETEGPDGTVTKVANGSGHSYLDSSGRSALFEDPDLSFSVYYDRQSRRDRTWNWVPDPTTYMGVLREDTSDTSWSASTLHVTCKGVSLHSRAVNLSGSIRHVVFVAADPLTGALVVNVQEVHSSTRVPQASWIFVIDDTGGRPLSGVMNVPENIKVSANSALISV